MGGRLTAKNDCRNMEIDDWTFRKKMMRLMEIAEEMIGSERNDLILKMKHLWD